MSALSPTFLIGYIRIGSVEGASCVNLGNNLEAGFQSYKKENNGLGSITGDNNDIKDLKSALRDSNVIDMLNDPVDDELPGWVKDLIKGKLKD